jgi:hypothetical protein
LNSSQNREKIDDFVDQMMNNSSVSFLKDKNQDKLKSNVIKNKTKSGKKDKKNSRADNDKLMN